MPYPHIGVVDRTVSVFCAIDQCFGLGKLPLSTFDFRDVCQHGQRMRISPPRGPKRRFRPSCPHTRLPTRLKPTLHCRHKERRRHPASIFAVTVAPSHSPMMMPVPAQTLVFPNPPPPFPLPWTKLRWGCFPLLPSLYIIVTLRVPVPSQPLICRPRT